MGVTHHLSGDPDGEDAEVDFFNEDVNYKRRPWERVSQLIERFSVLQARSVRLKSTDLRVHQMLVSRFSDEYDPISVQSTSPYCYGCQLATR